MIHVTARLALGEAWSSSRANQRFFGRMKPRKPAPGCSTEIEGAPNGERAAFPQSRTVVGLCGIVLRFANLEEVARSPTQLQHRPLLCFRGGTLRGKASTFSN